VCGQSLVCFPITKEYTYYPEGTKYTLTRSTHTRGVGRDSSIPMRIPILYCRHNSQRPFVNLKTYHIDLFTVSCIYITFLL